MEEAKSAASWPSIIAGAFVAAASSMILLALGSGLGFASISPWPNRGATITAFVITTAIWIIVTQWLSAALGGYIAGRLRTRWIGTHTHEVFFRDTAHGLVTLAAKRAAAQASIYLALSMLVGAFIASVSAALGGRIRDEHL